MFQKIKNNQLSLVSFFFLLTALGFIGAIIYLSFYNHPHTDDYILGYNLRELGFTNYQTFIYKNWGGRYFTNIVGALFGVHQFLFHYYYLHTIALIFLFFYSSYFFLQSINTFWLHKFFNASTIVVVSVFADITLITCIPEISTAFFWFSSSITYLTSVVLLLLFFGIIIRLIRIQLPHQQIPLWILFWILIAMLCGTNEVAALISGFILLIFFILTKKTVRFFNIMVFVTACVYISFFLFSALAPGNAERLSLFGEKNFISIIGGSFIRTAYVFFNIFQSPLFYISSILLLFLGIQYGGNTFVKKRGKSLLTNFTITFFIISISLFILHLPLLFHSNGSLPERATNVYVIATTIALFMAIFYAGTQIDNQAIVLLSIEPRTHVCFLLIMSISIYCNSTSKEIIKSIVAAKLYDSILTEREKVLKNANGKSIILPNYDSAAVVQYSKIYGKNQKEIFKRLTFQKPTLLFFDDDLSSEKNIQEIKRYFQLDSITVIQQKIPK